MTKGLEVDPVFHRAAVMVPGNTLELSDQGEDNLLFALVLAHFFVAPVAAASLPSGKARRLADAWFG